MSTKQPRDPRAELAAKLTGSGLTSDAAGTAAQLARLPAEPTDQDLDTEAKRLLAEAKPSDFAEGHAGHQSAYLRILREKIVAERKAETDQEEERGRRLDEAAGPAVTELDRRLRSMRRN